LKVRRIDGQKKGFSFRQYLATAALLASLAILAVLFLREPTPASCPNLEIARVELDLLGNPTLSLGGNQITRLPAANLRGAQYLTGRAVFEGAAECTCTWRGRTDRESTMRKIDAPAGGCAFQLALPETYSRVFLRLAAGPQVRMFTIETVP
jgi:hypothetical protein